MSTNFLSMDEIADIVNNPIVKTNKENLTGNSINFSIPLTDTLKVKLEQLGLDLSQLTSIPMRWMKGDTAPHKDKGPSQFKNTYLIYLTDNSGNLIVDGQSYPIAAGDAHIFNEGLEHYTINTGESERLMIGPMSESGVRVGVALGIPVFFFSDIFWSGSGEFTSDPTGFVYVTIDGSPNFGKIRMFDVPPPIPLSNPGMYEIIDYNNNSANWSPPGKTFGGWKYWGITYENFQPIVNDLSHIYRPGETYEYSAPCVLIPNWIDLPRPPRFSLHFTDNSMVYYKSHSLSTGGGGSGVRNYRHKRRKT